MTEANIENIIIQSLIRDPDYIGKVIPYIDGTFFEDSINEAIFNSIKSYFVKVGKQPEKNILLVNVGEENLSDSQFEEAQTIVKESFQEETVQDTNWLLEQTEQWCQERSMYHTIMKAISIYDGSDKTLSPHAIPDMMRDSLSISFETNIGYDWAGSAEDRFHYYSEPEHKVPFLLETLNEITNGGIPTKTLNLILAGVHVGKTMSLVHLACDYIRQGFDVLYVSMEMSENEILQRVDANLLKVPMHELVELGKDKFMTRIHGLRSKSFGDLKVIQYPTSVGTSGHIEQAMNDLRTKMHWTPSVVMIDYIGIVASSKIKVGSTNSHFYLKSVAEELRALGIKHDVIVWSAMQLTRGGMGSSDPDMTDIAESIGIPGVCDFMLAAMRTEELDQLGHIAYKQLKNRYRRLTLRPRFVLGSDMDQQCLRDVAKSEQHLVNEDYEYSQEELSSKFNTRMSNRFGDFDMGE